MKDLNGKVAVVTGAGRGIGFHLATALHNEGVFVQGLDLSFPLAHYPFATLEVDLANVTVYPKIIEFLSTSQAKVDIVVNNAGITLASNSEK